MSKGRLHNRVGLEVLDYQSVVAETRFYDGGQHVGGSCLKCLLDIEDIGGVEDTEDTEDIEESLECSLLECLLND